MARMPWRKRVLRVRFTAVRRSVTRTRLSADTVFAIGTSRIAKWGRRGQMRAGRLREYDSEVSSGLLFAVWRLPRGQGWAPGESANLPVGRRAICGQPLEHPFNATRDHFI